MIVLKQGVKGKNSVLGPGHASPGGPHRFVTRHPWHPLARESGANNGGRESMCFVRLNAGGDVKKAGHRPARVLVQEAATARNRAAPFYFFRTRLMTSSNFTIVNGFSRYSTAMSEFHAPAAEAALVIMMTGMADVAAYC